MSRLTLIACLAALAGTLSWALLATERPVVDPSCDDVSPNDAAELAHNAAAARAAFPREHARIEVRDAEPTFPSGTLTASAAVPFAHLVAGRPLARLEVHVRDATSGRPMAGARYLWQAPGSPPSAGVLEHGSGVIQVRSGLAGNLRVEAAGYVAASFRQLRFRNAGELEKVVEFRLQRRSER